MTTDNSRLRLIATVLVVLSLGVASAATIGYVVFSSIEEVVLQHPVTERGLERARADTRVTERLGNSLTVRFGVSGTVENGDTRSTVHAIIPVRGSLSKGELEVRGHREAGAVHFDVLRLKLRDDMVDLLRRPIQRRVVARNTTPDTADDEVEPPEDDFEGFDDSDDEAEVDDVPPPDFDAFDFGNDDETDSAEPAVPADIPGAREAIKRGALREAMTGLTSILKREPGNVDARLLRSDIWARGSQYLEAMEDIEAAAKVAPEDPQIAEARALLFAQQRKYVECADAYQVAIKLAPKRGVYYWRRSDCFEAAGNIIFAKRERLQACHVEPDYEKCPKSDPDAPVFPVDKPDVGSENPDTSP